MAADLPFGRLELRVDARKWLMAKLAPKKYGDSVALTGGGERPLAIRWLSHEEAPKELE